jgi:hypothetical protein
MRLNLVLPSVFAVLVFIALVFLAGHILPLSDQGIGRLALGSVLVVLTAVFSWQASEAGTAGPGLWAFITIFGGIWSIVVVAINASIGHVAFLEVIQLREVAWATLPDTPLLLSAGFFFIGIGIIGLLRELMLRICK